MARHISDKLYTWSELSREPWPTLLVGNGMCINISERFAYDSLHDQTTFSTLAKSIFSELKTTDFELVLETLMHADIVLDAIGQPVPTVGSLQREVRKALFTSVRQVHPRWMAIPDSTLHKIGRVLNRHTQVFTTNYDLLPYWAVMTTPSVKIGDFFWSDGNTFDAGATELFQGWTGLHFLHGGLHLWHDDRSGLVGKWVADGNDLLNLGTMFGRYPRRRPLFVSEGSHTDKLAAIRRSYYLNFVLDCLRDDPNDTVIFGSSLGGMDGHISAALRMGPRRTFAVSARPTTDADLMARMGYIKEQLKGHEVNFFDSTTHPLGNPTLALP